MSEETGSYLVRGDASQVGAALCELLGTENAAKLAALLAEVYGRTGFGDVHLVVANGRIELIKVTVSVKL